MSAKGGIEAEAFERLFRDCARDVHGYAISLLHDRQAAEDVTALAFERLFRSRRRIDPARGSARALLFTIARNAALDELRKRGRSPQPVALDEPLPDEASGHELEQVERRAALRGALAELSLREQEVLLLKFHGQLTNTELAKALGISESNAGTRLNRALGHLREQRGLAAQLEVA